ncbi:MAG: hypothetical protein QGG39_07740 [Candidatus Poribacteria bacterium]|nr:hypothetical protein [Candidatus Poribacteria bacterium]
MRRIGTLNEGLLHADLKQWYSQLGDKHEVEVEGYIIDLVRSDLLIEIQTGNFSQIRTKLTQLTERYPLHLVYPIAQTKWLCKEGSRRKSPKRGTWLHLFDQLVAIPRPVDAKQLFHRSRVDRDGRETRQQYRTSKRLESNGSETIKRSGSDPD